MGILHELNSRSVLCELTSRGLAPEQIEDVLERMIGPDWKQVRVADWHRRLQEQKLITHSEHARFLDDLEALISGRVLLDNLGKRGQRWGRA